MHSLKLFLIECNGLCTLIPDSNLQNFEVTKTIVTNFKNLVEKHFKKWHQVKFYAEALSVTPNYLNEVIISSVNIPAKEFIQNRLILEAKRMIFIYRERAARKSVSTWDLKTRHISASFLKATQISLYLTSVKLFSPKQVN